MDIFLRRLSLLLVLLILAGCGRERAGTPPGRPYPVTMEQGVLVAPVVPPASARRSGGVSGSVNFGGSGSCNLGGSGGDALAVIAVVIVVVVVVAVVVCAVDAATAGPDPVVERYYLTLSGEGVPLEVVVITDTNHLYLEQRQYDALAQGAYNRAVLRPAVWEGARTAPTQLVQVSVAKGRITIAVAPQAEQPPQAVP